MHELGHAIGLHHEQVRRDRDDHLWVRFDHIDPYYRYNSEMEREDNIDNYGVAYDYASIMHYGEDVSKSPAVFVRPIKTSSNGKVFRVTVPFLRGIHRWPANSPQKGDSNAELWCLFFICAWIQENGLINNHEAGDLRRLSAHYDVIVMHRRMAFWNDHLL